MRFFGIWMIEEGRLILKRMHKDEIIPELDLVHRLIMDQFPEWGDLPIVPVRSSGTDHAMYRLGDEMVIRMPRRPGGGAGVEREYRWVPFLGAHLPVPVSIPMAKGEPGCGYPYPWLVLPWLEGSNPVVGEIVDPHQLAREIGDFVCSMRQINPEGGPPTGKKLEQRDMQVRSDIAALSDEIDVEEVTAAWEAALVLPESDRAVWAHGDLAPGNLLLVDDRLHGVIDFTGTGIGDPAIDLQVAWNLLPCEVRETFRNAVGADDVTWGRARGRALAQALVQLPYYKETNIPLATNARHVIREVLAEWRLGS